MNLKSKRLNIGMNSHSRLFSPSKVAVVGVSSDPTKLGTVIYDNIERGGFEGELVAVNPKYDTLYGKKCYSRVSKVDGKLDLVVIVVPSTFVLGVLKDCAKKKVAYAIIISAGFSEVGDEGRALEREVTSIAKRNNIRLIGPNCLGVTFSDSKLNASFAAQAPLPGNIAFMSQSGAFNTALLDLADNRRLGFKYFVSLGNKADISELDLLAEWLQDDSIAVIGAYIEQFSDGRRFLDILANNKNKPIILLSSGESEAGRKAIASHTGSLAGSSNVIRAALRQYGVVQVDSEEKMLSALMIFSRATVPATDRVAVITNAGGPGIILTDHLERHGFRLAKLEKDTVQILRSALPPAASISNPVDVLGDAMSDRYKAALDALDKDENVDTILLLLTPQLTTQIEETAKLVINYSRRSSTPIIPIFIGERYAMQGLERLWSNDVAAYQYIEEAVSALSYMKQHREHLEAGRSWPKLGTARGRHHSVVSEFIGEQESVLPDTLSKSLCAELKIDLPREIMTDDLDEVISFFKKVGSPIVLKARSEDVVHKVDKKYIYLKLSTEQQIATAFKQLYKKVAPLTSPLSPKLLVQEMITGGAELIVGVDRDGSSDGAGFGHTLLVGTGGIYTEVYRDTAMRVVNIARDEAEQMLSETRIYKLLNGYRGQKKLASSQVVDLLMKVQRMVNLYPEISSMDINPLIVTEDRAIAVDVKLFAQR